MEEITNEDEAIQTKEHVVPIDPLLFYIRDHEVHFSHPTYRIH